MELEHLHARAKVPPDPLGTSELNNSRRRPPRVLALLGLAAFSFWTCSDVIPRIVRGLALEAWVPPVLQLALVHVLGLGAVIWAGVLATDARASEQFPMRRVRLFELGTLLCGMAGVSILGSEAANWLLRIAGGETLVISGEASGPPQNIFLTLAVVVGIVPWTEELLFRGLVLDGMRPSLGDRGASLASAAAFSLFHLDPLQMPLAFVAGLLLAQWRLRTESLAPCIIGHAFLNAFPFLLIGIVGDIPGYGFEREPSLRQPWSFNLLGLGLLSVGIAGLVGAGNRQPRDSRAVGH